MNLEAIDRRLFLRGLTLSSAGLVIPRTVFGFQQDDTKFVQGCIDYKGWVPSGAYTISAPIVEGKRGMVIVGSRFNVRGTAGLIVKTDNHRIVGNWFMGASNTSAPFSFRPTTEALRGEQRT